MDKGCSLGQFDGGESGGIEYDRKKWCERVGKSVRG